MPISLSHPTSSLSHPTSRLVREAMTVGAALLCAIASLAAVMLLVAGPSPTPGQITGTEGPTVTLVQPAALTSTTTDDRSYSHTWSTVIHIPDTDPSSSSYTPPVCERDQLLIQTGDYSFGTSFGWQGSSYDRDGLFLHGGFYRWSDCLFASPSGGYLQLARLTRNDMPDDGRHDAAIITHPRDTPNWRDADEQGRFAWGSFLTNTD